MFLSIKFQFIFKESYWFRYNTSKQCKEVPLHKFASSVNMYKFTHFWKFTFLWFFKNCLLRLLGQRPQSPSNNIKNVGYSFILNVNGHKYFTIAKKTRCNHYFKDCISFLFHQYLFQIWNNYIIKLLAPVSMKFCHL